MAATMALTDMVALAMLFMLGRLGPEHVAAVTMGGIFIEIVFSVAMGISTGTVALCARYIGARKPEKAHSAVVQAILLSAVFSVFFAAGGVLSAGWIMSSLGLTGLAARLGARYLTIVALGAPLVFVPFSLGASLRAAGDTITPVKIMASANLLSLAAAPFLIFGPGPLPALGITGAALAHVLANLFGACLFFFVFFAGRSYYRLTIGMLRLDWPLLKALINIGFFGSVQTIIRNISVIILARIVSGFGVNAVAAYGIAMKLRGVVLMPGLAFGGAMSALVGQNLGAGRPGRAERAGWQGAFIYFLFLAVMTVTAWFYAEGLVGFFNRAPQVVADGGAFLRIFALSFVFLAFSATLSRALNGAGDTISPMVITFVALIVLRWPLAVWLAGQYQLAGVAMAMAISNVFQGLATPAWFRLGRWKLKALD